MGKLKEWWDNVSDEDKQRCFDKIKQLSANFKKTWLCVDKSGQEVLIISKNPPHRMPQKYWIPYDKDSISEYDIHFLDDGFIENHIGRKLTWEDEPVEIIQ